ncbi:MAG: hypothetical protein WBE37_28550 [Bryobacteraceae bacterium]
MGRIVLRTSSLPILIANLCFGQIPGLPATTSSSIEILLPPGLNSERFFVRYSMTGGNIGGWIQPRPNVSSYTISTTHEVQTAARIKALLFNPGCAIQTFDVPLSNQGSQQYSFVCQSLPNIQIVGKLVRSDRLYGRNVRLQTRYVARWAQSFLGLDSEIVEFIPIAETNDVLGNGDFRLSLPDLSRDALAGSADHSGELQIWARDAATGRIVAQLIPAGPGIERTRMGGLKIQTSYPSEIIFAPCAANNPRVRDAMGFALRPGPEDMCDR